MLKKFFLLGMVFLSVFCLIGCVKKVDEGKEQKENTTPTAIVEMQVTNAPKTTEVPQITEAIPDSFTFTCAELVAELQSVLDKEGNEFSKEELQEVTELTLQCGAGINLAELSNLCSLKFVSLSGCGVNELLVLSELSELEYLYLENVELDALEQLPELTSVQVLYLYDTKITSLAGIDKLTGLRELYISGSLIEDADVYKSRLQRLKSCEIEVPAKGQTTEYASFIDAALEEELRSELYNYTDPITFEELDTITLLMLMDERTCALDDLKQCRNLETLIIYGTQVSNLMPLMEIASLKEVIIYTENELDYSCLLAVDHIVRVSMNDKWVKGEAESVSE